MSSQNSRDSRDSRDSRERSAAGSEAGPVRVVIYARVSTAKEEQRESIPSQLAALRRFCAGAGFEVVGEFSDQRTGRNENRPGWQAVVRLCEARAVDRIVVTARDRLHRNRRNFERFRDEFMDRYGVRLQPLMGVLVREDDLYSRFQEEDEFTQAERFSLLLGWRTRNGQTERRRRGYWPTKPPFGTVTGRERGVPERDPAAWPVVEELFRRAAAGASGGELLAWTRAQGVRTSTGAELGHTTLARVLANPFYVGEAWVEGEAFELRHDCRVDRAVWEAAQAEEVAGPVNRGGRPPCGEYLYLCPRVVCSHYAVVAAGRKPPGEERAQVGGPLPLRAKYTIGRGGRRYPYYYRADRLRASGGVLARRVDPGPELRTSIPAVDLDEAVLNTLEREGRNPGLLRVRLSSTAAEPPNGSA